MGKPIVVPKYELSQIIVVPVGKYSGRSGRIAGVANVEPKKGLTYLVRYLASDGTENGGSDWFTERELDFRNGENCAKILRSTEES